MKTWKRMQRVQLSRKEKKAIFIIYMSYKTYRRADNKATINTNAYEFSSFDVGRIPYGINVIFFRKKLDILGQLLPLYLMDL